MPHRNENFIRTHNPELRTGVDEKKLQSVIGTITHRNGQIGKMKLEFSIHIPLVFSVKEIRTLAHHLMKNHRLSFRITEVNSLW